MDKETFYTLARAAVRTAMSDSDLYGPLHMLLNDTKYFDEVKPTVVEEVSLTERKGKSLKTIAATRKRRARAPSFKDWRDAYVAKGFVVVAEVGGKSGGNYMGGEAKEYVTTPERYGIEVALDAFLCEHAPTLSSMLYRSMIAKVCTHEHSVREYYGNATYYRVWFLSFDNVWSILEEHLRVETERDRYVADLEERVRRVEALLSNVDLDELERDVRGLRRDVRSLEGFDF